MHSRVKATVVVAALAAVTLIRVGAGPDAVQNPTPPVAVPPTLQQSPSNSPTPTSTPTPRQGRPVGAIAFGNILATLDAEGVLRICREGDKNLSIGDLSDGKILFTDGDIYEVPLAKCRQTPRRILSLARVVGRTPSHHHMSCARYSPDDRLITFLLDRESSGSRSSHCSGGQEAWVVGSDGKDPRRIRKGPLGGMGSGPAGWADENHLAIVSSVDPVAIDIRTGELSFFTVPQMWRGSLSPGGRYSVYRIEDYSGQDPAVFVLDRKTGLERRISVPPPYGAEGSLPVSAWSPSETRFVTTAGSNTVRALVTDPMGKVVRSIKISGPSSPGPVAMGWFDDHRFWTTRLGVLELIDAITGARTLIAVPTRYDVSTTVVFTEHNRPGILALEPTIVAAANTPLHRDPISGSAFHHPPSWGVKACTGCLPTPYGDGLLVRGREPVLNYPYGDSGLSIGVTDDSVDEVIDRLSKEFGVGDPITGENGAVLHRRTIEIGGVPFERLEFGMYEGGVILYVGRPGPRTVLIKLDVEKDPSAMLVIDTMQFVAG